MTTKLKIDLAQGLLEVEGSETFVKAMYNDFKANFLGEEAEDLLKPQRRRRSRKKTKKPIPSKAAAKAAPPPAQPAAAVTPKAETVAKAEEAAYTYLKELDLSATKQRPSLVEFMDTKFPITNEERNLVFLHYLQNILKLNNITIDHLYTCYKAAKIRVPFSLDHSLQTTIEQRGWITMEDGDQLQVTPAGQRYVEKQLPKRVKS